MHAQQAALTLCGAAGWIARDGHLAARACCWPPCWPVPSACCNILARPLELDPWVHTAKPGQAMGNLRQRNQQATLLSMGCGLCCGWWRRPRRICVRHRREELGRPGRLHGGGRPWPLWLVGILTAWALALLAVGSAGHGVAHGAGAIVSDSGSAGAVALLRSDGLRSGWCWRAWPFMRLQPGCCPICCCNGPVFRAEGLFARFGDAPGCTSRRVLWSNVLHLIAQKPWLGWGWGSWTMRITTLFSG